MIGITGYSVYIPRYRIQRETIAAAWGSRSKPGAKAVCSFDEDSLTMAETAAWRLIVNGAAKPDRLYFASTSSPYWQRSASSQIAAACDLSSAATTIDFGGSLRSGTSAMLAAFDALKAEHCASAIVVASDKRDGAAESQEELTFSDAACGIELGTKNIIAEIIAAHSRSDDFMDEWRRDRDWFVQGQPSKYSLARGYEENVSAVRRAVLERAALAGSEVVTAKAPANLGEAGTATPLIALSHALANAKPGDLILCIGYGDGADALLLRAIRPGPAAEIAQPVLEYPSYALYRKSREYLRETAGGADISNVLWKREERQNIRLHGSKCEVCGTVQFPMTRVCVACRSSEKITEVPLGRTGRVFTFTKDYLYDAPMQPTVMTVIDLDGGGRFLCQMTDVHERDVRIGMPVDLVLRRMREGAQTHHYYWKCRPGGS